MNIIKKNSKMRNLPIKLFLIALSLHGFAYAETTHHDDARFFIGYDITDIVKKKIEQHEQDQMVPKQPQRPHQSRYQPIKSDLKTKKSIKQE